MCTPPRQHTTARCRDATMSSAAALASKIIAPLALRARTHRAAPRRAAGIATTVTRAHVVKDDSAISEMNVDPEIETFREHQASAAKLSFADECRTLVDLGRYGVISTFSREHGGEYPSGSIVGFAADDQGRPIFALSSMSGHTGDLKANGKCSLTVTAPGFAGAADARVTITGTVQPLAEGDETKAAREAYLVKHPDAFWVDFGDFSWHRMDGILGARLVGGFARAGGVSGDEYAAGKADPVAHFSGPIASHMNADHEDSLLAMVGHYVGLTVEKAAIASLDALGMNVRVTRGGESFKLRLPFESPATDRKAVKEVLVGMTKTAAKAAAAGKEEEKEGAEEKVEASAKEAA